MKFPIESARAIYNKGLLLTPRCCRIVARHNLNSIMIVLFGLLHVADGAVTYLGLCFSSVIEVNPVLNFFAGLLGLGIAIILLKLTILIFITVIFFERHTIKGCFGTAALAWADTVYGWVVTNNFALFIGA